MAPRSRRATSKIRFSLTQPVATLVPQVEVRVGGGVDEDPSRLFTPHGTRSVATVVIQGSLSFVRALAASTRSSRGLSAGCSTIAGSLGLVGARVVHAAAQPTRGVRHHRRLRSVGRRLGEKAWAVPKRSGFRPSTSTCSPMIRWHRRTSARGRSATSAPSHGHRATAGTGPWPAMTRSAVPSTEWETFSSEQPETDRDCGISIAHSRLPLDVPGDRIHRGGTATAASSPSCSRRERWSGCAHGVEHWVDQQIEHVHRKRIGRASPGPLSLQSHVVTIGDGSGGPGTSGWRLGADWGRSHERLPGSPGIMRHGRALRRVGGAHHRGGRGSASSPAVTTR